MGDRMVSEDPVDRDHGHGQGSRMVTEHHEVMGHQAVVKSAKAGQNRVHGQDECASCSLGG